MITEQQIDEALNFLSLTDEECAKLRRAVEAHDWLAERALSLEFLAADEDLSVALRNHKAKASADYRVQKEKWLDALEAFHKLENKRQTAKLQIGVWQSLVKARAQ